jgi:hypothetical protein
VNQASQEALIHWLANADALASDAPFLPTLEAVLEHHRAASKRFSDILEFSAQASNERIAYARFSYAFPGFHEDTVRETKALLHIANVMGIADAAERVMRVASQVAQPLIGLAMDDARTARPKLYLQFHQHTPKRARAIAAALLSVDLDALPEGALHLLGLDFHAGALASAKLYLHTEQVPLHIPQALVSDALAIHRLSDRRAAFVSEAFDFALTEEAQWPLLQRALPAFAAFRSLEETFALRVRRVSLAEASHLTAYYVLR